MEGMEKAVDALGQRCDFEGDLPSALGTSPCISAAVASCPHLVLKCLVLKSHGDGFAIFPSLSSRLGEDSDGLQGLGVVAEKH